MFKQLLQSTKRTNRFELMEQRNQFLDHIRTSTTILNLHKKQGMRPSQIAHKLKVPHKQVTQVLKEYSA